MKVDQFSELRNRLAPAGAEMHVVKNSFLKRAIDRLRTSGCGGSIDGPNCDRDRREGCRAGRENFEDICGGIQDRGARRLGLSIARFLPSKDVEAMADLPSREVLLAQLLGLACTGDTGRV